MSLCLDYCETVNANIELFLKDKTKKARVALENAKADFTTFWELIGAEGDLGAALSEWNVAHNSSASGDGFVGDGGSILSRLAHKARRVVRQQRP